MKEIWKKGKHPSQVVSNIPIVNTNFPIEVNCGISSDSDIEYYGGYLVCESIGNSKHQDLIASAPEMKSMLRTFINAIEGGTIDEQGCYTQRFGKAMLDKAKLIIGQND